MLLLLRFEVENLKVQNRNSLVPVVCFEIKPRHSQEYYSSSVSHFKRIF